MHTDPASYTEAIEVCNKAGGRLATADDDRELVQMHSMGEDRFFLAITGLIHVFAHRLHYLYIFPRIN